MGVPTAQSNRSREKGPRGLWPSWTQKSLSHGGPSGVEKSTPGLMTPLKAGWCTYSRTLGDYDHSKCLGGRKR